jgi:CRP/FNR family transcriptional regulator, cyclic AMP receptor protein
MDVDLRSAVSMSYLRELPAEVLDELLAGSTRIKIFAGSVTHWEGEPDPHLELVISGVVRVFVTAADGRTMTVRYCRPGALLGVMSLFTTGFAMPAATQALVDAEVLRMSATVARRLGTYDLRVARAFLGELSERALSFVYEIPGGAFATVRQRVARHLLDLASTRVGDQPTSDHQAGRELLVQVSQQELANAVGTVREVVVRVLRELRQDGVVRTERDRIVLLEPGRLIQEQGWNQGS